MEFYTGYLLALYVLEGKEIKLALVIHQMLYLNNTMQLGFHVLKACKDAVIFH